MSRFLSDAPPTVAEITGMTRLAAAAAEHTENEDAAQLRARLIADGRIKPAGRAEGTRAMLIAKGVIQPADPAEVEQARKPRLIRATLQGGYDAMIAAGER